LKRTYDLAIVGSGFSGALLAMIARRLGRSVVLLERGFHPRVAIGESSTPLSNLLLEELSLRYDLPEVRTLCKWGSWQRVHPELACGLKRGFTFHHHNLTVAEALDPDRRDQLLVTASPHDEIADTHWYRADFDEFLVKQAQELGVEYVDRISLSDIEDTGGEWSLLGRRGGIEETYRARLLVDATGPRGFLHGKMGLKDAGFPNFPRTRALYSHFKNVSQLAQGSYSRTDALPPFPIDDAAVHHVFEGGWIWVLKFNNGVTSAGAVAVDEVAESLGFEEGGRAWERLLGKIPALQEQFSSAVATQPFTYSPNLPFRSEKVTGRNWALLPSAAGFVDPLLSTGFPLTLLGVVRLAEVISQDDGSDAIALGLERYEEATTNEVLATARLVGTLYSATNNFQVFSALTLLYFAAASYSEAARRLGRAHLAASFLLHDHPSFGPACATIYQQALSTQGRDLEAIRQNINDAIAPIDVAGLCKSGCKNWYPLNPSDIIGSCGKLGATSAEVEDLLLRSGFVL
jgi:tetracycline 7-halogenase / FADH2 O2-dependent halogenase